MPTKRRKAAKKKKEMENPVHSPTNSHGNRERDEEHGLISQEEKEIESDSSVSSGTQKATMEDGSENNVVGENNQKKEDEGVTVSVPVVSVEEETSLPNPDSETKVVAVEHVSPYESSANEESKSVENLPESKVEESVGSVSVTDPVDNPIERVVSVEEEVKLVAEATPDEIPGVTTDVEASSVENIEVTQVAETENSLVTQITEATSVENAGVVGELDAPLVESRETMAKLSSEAVSEMPTDTVESHNESEDHGSISNEDPPVVSVLPPVRPTSWRGCCGLFDLFRRSPR